VTNATEVLVPWINLETQVHMTKDNAAQAIDTGNRTPAI